MNALRKFLSKEDEPLRRWLYGVVGSGLLVLGAYGVVSDKEAAAWSAVASSALLIPGVELARQKVTPHVPDDERTDEVEEH